MGPAPVVWEIGALVCFWQDASDGELQLPPAHPAEAGDEPAGILARQFAGLVANLGEDGGEAGHGGILGLGVLGSSFRIRDASLK